MLSAFAERRIDRPGRTAAPELSLSFVEDMAAFQPPLLERQQAPFPAYRPLSEEGLQEKGKIFIIDCLNYASIMYLLALNHLTLLSHLLVLSVVCS